MNDDDQKVHLRLSPEDAQELDRIVRWMAGQRELCRVDKNPSRPKAIRYAIGRLVALLPAETEEAGG